MRLVNQLWNEILIVVKIYIIKLRYFYYFFIFILNQKDYYEIMKSFTVN